MYAFTSSFVFKISSFFDSTTLKYFSSSISFMKFLKLSSCIRVSLTATSMVLNLLFSLMFPNASLKKIPKTIGNISAQKSIAFCLRSSLKVFLNECRNISIPQIFARQFQENIVKTWLFDI